MCDYGEDRVADYQIIFKGSPEDFSISLCESHFAELAEAVYKEMQKNI